MYCSLGEGVFLCVALAVKVCTTVPHKYCSRRTVVWCLVGTVPMCTKHTGTQIYIFANNKNS